jgi:hypothetical protein
VDYENCWGGERRASERLSERRASDASALSDARADEQLRIFYGSKIDTKDSTYGSNTDPRSSEFPQNLKPDQKGAKDLRERKAKDPKRSGKQRKSELLFSRDHNIFACASDEDKGGTRRDYYSVRATLFREHYLARWRPSNVHLPRTSTVAFRTLRRRRNSMPTS